MNQVGKGNVAVVSPPGIYDNMAHPGDMAAAGGDQQYGQPPPDYSHGIEESGFSDGAIRRGEGLEGARSGQREKQKARKANVFLSFVVRAGKEKATFTPSFALRCFS